MILTFFPVAGGAAVLSATILTFSRSILTFSPVNRPPILTFHPQWNPDIFPGSNLTFFPVIEVDADISPCSCPPIGR